MQIFIRYSWARIIVPAGLLLALTLAQAQSSTDTNKPQQIDPANADTPVAAVAYRSSFTGYRPWPDEPVAAWKDSNDLTGKIGGWRVYAREARQPDVSTVAPVSIPTKALGGQQ